MDEDIYAYMRTALSNLKMARSKICCSRVNPARSAIGLRGLANQSDPLQLRQRCTLSRLGWRIAFSFHTRFVLLWGVCVSRMWSHSPLFASLLIDVFTCCDARFADDSATDDGLVLLVPELAE
jgi:hypothetical protein